MPDTAEQRLTELETRAAFQERLIQQLDEALASQQAQLNALRRRVDWLLCQTSGERDLIRRPEDDEPPPHY